MATFVLESLQTLFRAIEQLAVCINQRQVNIHENVSIFHVWASLFLFALFPELVSINSVTDDLTIQRLIKLPQVHFATKIAFGVLALTVERFSTIAPRLDQLVQRAKPRAIARQERVLFVLA